MLGVMGRRGEFKYAAVPSSRNISKKGRGTAWSTHLANFIAPVPLIWLYALAGACLIGRPRTAEPEAEIAPED